MIHKLLNLFISFTRLLLPSACLQLLLGRLKQVLMLVPIMATMDMAMVSMDMLAMVMVMVTMDMVLA